MDHDTRGDAIINTTTHEQDEDHRDAMEVDGAPSMMIDTSHSHDSIVDNGVTPVETNAAVSPMVTTANEAPAPSSQSRDFGSAPDTPRSALPGSREPPAFDEDTERPRQRRRYHVTVEDENTGEIRTVTDTTLATTGGTSAGEDEVAVLVTAPPRLGDLSIHTPRSATPPPAATVESAMQDVVPSPPAPAAPRGSSNPQSPHIGTIPLPDVPPPPPRNPNEPPDPVMQAARRLTTAPDGNADQLQADLALLAPYIAAQAMAAAFPPGGGRPPGGAPGGGAPNPSNGAPNPGNGAPNAPNGQQQPEGQGGTNNAGPPPFPFPFGFPFMFGGNTEVPPDPKRAERLANGLKVVEDGLLKRWRAVCGEEGAVCAVCYGELLEEPGIEKEKEKGKAKDEDENAMDGQADGEDQSAGDEEAHSRALREALKRREEMEKLERQEKELKLETAVLAFPCGHVFHRTCLLPWLSRHTTCPTCRFDIDPKSDTLTLPADDGMPPFLGPNGFNFGDFFTVGPVLRMPRAHAPNLGPRPVPGHNHTHEHDPGHRRERRDSNQPADGSRPRPSGDADNAGASRSMNDLFDSLFGPLFEAVGTPAARRPAATTPAQPSQEPAGQEPAAPVAAQEASTQEAPAQSTQPSETPASRTPPSIADLDLPRSRTGPPIATEYRPIDYNRPLAMFGRPSPRRPPQPVTPAWMRPPRPPPTTSTPGTSTAPAPSTSAARASSAPASTPSASTTRAEPTPSSRPAAPSGSQPTDSSRGLGQIRAIVSNLIPRRLNASARAARSTASIRSNRSNESAGSSSATQTGPRPALTPLSPRAGIRAILQGPTALLRDLASRRPADPETEDRPRDSVDTLPRQSLGDDMPGLESDTEDGSTYSEDDVHTSEDDADMPALEPVEPRVPRAPAASTSESQSTPGNNAQPPPPVSSSTQESAQPSQSTSNGTNADQPPTFGPPRPPADDNPNMMDNIITLRIDLGHADGRDETIIVPLLFNPSGRNNDQNQRGEPRPAAAQPPPPSRQRTPPPPKKWVPPEPIKTFRQVVEEKEREAGWRCDDPACLLGPADDEEPSNEHPIKPMYSIMRSLSPDDDTPRYKIEDGIRVYAGGEDVRVKGENPVCAHQLHPECLVTSARVNGWGPDHNSKSNSRVTLRCPVCRLEGTVERQIWDAGVEAEEAGEA